MMFEQDDRESMCSQFMPVEDVICTRGADHNGQHVADNDEEIIAIWEPDGTVLYALPHLSVNS